MYFHYLCLIFGLLLATTSESQSVILIEPNEFNISEDTIDLSDDYFYMHLPSYMSNLSADTVGVVWKRVIPENCPEEWQFWMSDKYLSYLPWVDSSAFELVMAPGETDAYYSMMFYPRGVPGCCEVDVIFSSFENSNIVFDTIQYNIKMNDENCGATGNQIDHFNNEKPIVFPNPFTNSIHLSSKNNFDEIIIQNYSGVKVQSLSRSISNQYDLSTLPEGVYFVHLLADKKVIQSEKIIKVSNLK